MPSNTCSTVIPTLDLNRRMLFRGPADAMKAVFLRLWYFVLPAGRQLLDSNEIFFDTPDTP